MSVRYQVRKVRRDGVSQRYWVNPSRDHDDAVTAVMGGDLATAESRKKQRLAQQLLQQPSVQDSVYRSLVRQYEETKSFDSKPMLFLRSYLSGGYRGAESLLVRLATEPSSWHIRAAAIHTMATPMEPRVPRLIREVLDKTTDEWTARYAIDQLISYLNITMQNFVMKKLMPTREAILDALETLGLALQGKWFEPKSEINSLLPVLSYSRSEFERAVQGQIPARVEETLIDGLVSSLALRTISEHDFGRILNVVKEWGSEYALDKLRSLWNSLDRKGLRDMVFDAVAEIKHRLNLN